MNPSILAEIAALTDRNEHTQARLVLAEHIGAADSVAVLRLIQKDRKSTRLNSSHT